MMATCVRSTTHQNTRMVYLDPDPYGSASRGPKTAAVYEAEPSLSKSRKKGRASSRRLLRRETGDDAHGPRLLASTRRSRHPAARWETWLSVTTRGSVSGPRRTLQTAAAPARLRSMARLCVGSSSPSAAGLCAALHGQARQAAAGCPRLRPTYHEQHTHGHLKNILQRAACVATTHGRQSRSRSRVSGRPG